jgi:hypothetical protein
MATRPEVFVMACILANASGRLLRNPNGRWHRMRGHSSLVRSRQSPAYRRCSHTATYASSRRDASARQADSTVEPPKAYGREYRACARSPVRALHRREGRRFDPDTAVSWPQPCSFSRPSRGSAPLERRFFRSFDPAQRLQRVRRRRAGVALGMMATQLLA